MTTRQNLLAVLALVLLADAALGQLPARRGAPPPSPPPIEPRPGGGGTPPSPSTALAQRPTASALLSTFDATLRQTLDVEPFLADNRELLGNVVRKNPRIAKAWHLEPSLATGLNDAEIFAYVVRRANIATACALDILSAIDLDSDAAAADPPDVRQTYLPKAAFNGRALSADCATVESAPGTPARIRTRDQFAPFARLAFSPIQASAAFRQKTTPAARQRLERNLGQLRPEAGRVSLASEVAAAAGLRPDAVVMGRVLTLIAYVRVDRPAPEVILVTPFTW